MRLINSKNLARLLLFFIMPVLTMLMAGCASFGPYHGNTAEQPFNSVRGSQDGRYKLAFIEFGDQGSPLDNAQIKAALEVIHQAPRPVLFVYIHGWQNNADSRDVCRFEHFLDSISRVPEATGRGVNVIGVYIAWRGRDLTFPGLNLLTFYSRKAVAAQIASQVSCLATLNELALAARDPSKKVHRCILIGHSFGGLLLGNTLSHSILDASGTGARNSNPWDMAVTFNSADSSISTRQLLKELDYLYRYDPDRHAYVSRSSSGGNDAAVPENRPFLVFLQSENDSATGTFFPIGTEFYNTIGLRYHWQKVPVPGHPGEKVSESEFYTHTPGNNPYLVNYHVVPLGEASPPLGLKGTENRAFEANILENHPDYSFYTSEHNDGHENQYCKNGTYTPDEVRPATGRELWRRWQFVYTGNARVPCWVVRVPKEIIFEHGGLWSDNSVAMLAALFRIEFPLPKNGELAAPPLIRAPSAPDIQQ
jgi:pimeloyl-ACP methyl ester carboxylesterase